MQDRLMLRLGGMLAGSLLLGACASTPGRGAPSHYAMDSLSAQCRANPVYCATATGREVATGPVRTVGTTVTSTAVVVAALDKATKLSIQSTLVATGETGPHFQRNHRDPGTRPVIPAQSLARADSVPKPQGHAPSVATAVPSCTPPPR